MIIKDKHNGFILFGAVFYNYNNDPQGMIKAGVVYYNGRVKETVRLYTEKEELLGTYYVPTILVKTRVQGKGKHCTLIKKES